MNRQQILFSIFLLVSAMCSGQLTDLARLEYTFFPQESSDNSFRRFRTFINVPLKLKEDTYIVPGFEYRNVNLKFEDVTPFERENLDRYQSFSLSLGYTTKISEKWRLGARVASRATSNFSTGKLTSDDIIHTGAIYFINDKTNEGLDKPWRLILGGRFDTESGRPFPLPFVNYYKEFHSDWSFVLGVPKSNIKRYFGTEKKHIMQAFLTLDGFYANIQEDLNVAQTNDTSDEAFSISMTVVLSGLGYEYLITDHLVFYVYAGYTVINDIRLRNEDRDDVFTINDKNTFYARSGIKFKL